MWRWTVILYSLIFYGYTLSQPVKDNCENSRQARQLDISECCPCPGAGQAEDHDFRAQRLDESSSKTLFARSRDMDECPCRPEHSDSEGASSIIFPTSMRADGAFVRPVAKKEDLKPLLHPEVDLASSVLQTLREVTDEEYQDALTRHATRSFAKEAEESEITDSTPEASTGSIVTIMMNPKEINGEDDITPHESGVHESRCIHAPLESGRTNFAKMRVAPKSSSLLREIFELPRVGKPTGIFHRNLLDMDNNVGASNTQEHVVPISDNTVTNRNLLKVTKSAPIMKLDSYIQNNGLDTKSKVDDDCGISKVPDFKSTSVQNRLKDWISSRSSSEKKMKINSFPIVPKMKSDKSLFKSLVNNKGDSSFSPSNIQDQTEEKNAYSKTKSNIENILEKTRSIGLKNLFKLKDVELVPLKDIVNTATAHSNFKRPNKDLPTSLNKRHDVILQRLEYHPTEVSENLETIETLTKSNNAENLDSEVIPSHIIKQISNDSCDGKAIKKKFDTGVDAIKENVLSTEILDTVPSPSNIQSVVIKENIDFSQTNKLNNDFAGDNSKIIGFNEKNQSQSSEICLDDKEKQDFNKDELNSRVTELIIPDNTEEHQYQGPISVSNGDYCENKKIQADSITDSSINKNYEFEEEDTGQGSISVPNEYDCEHKKTHADSITDSNMNKNDIFEEEDAGLAFLSVSSEDDCENKKIHPDSITDSSMNMNNEFEEEGTVREKSDKLFVEKNLKSEDSDSQEQQAGDNIKSLDSKVKLLNASYHKTLSVIKNNIINKFENRKKPTTIARTTNKFDHQTSSDEIKSNESMLSEDENKDTDCQNDESIRITIKDPDLNNNENVNESSDKIGMQDLQKISDLMLQEEENKLESKTVECNTPSEAVIEINVGPTEINSRHIENDSRDLENSASSDHKILIDTHNSADVDDIMSINVENTCQSVLALPNQEIDADTVASEVKINRIPQNDESIGTPLFFKEMLKENDNDFNLLKTSLPDIRDVLKLPPLPTVDEVKLQLTTLFDKNARNVSPSEVDSMSDTSIMLTDASTTNYKLKPSPFRLEDVNLDILQLKPQLRVTPNFNIPKIDLHSYQSRLPWLEDVQLKPIKLQSVVEEKDNLLGASLIAGHNNGRASDVSRKVSNVQLGSIPSLDTFRTQLNLKNHHFKTHIPLLAENPSQGLIDLSENINSHAKKTWRTMQQTLESKFRQASDIPTKLQSQDFLEVISRNHEDVNDKLKALHIDFNDRIETMRNNFLDKPRMADQSRSTKPNMKSFSNFRNQNKGKQFSLQTSQPKLMTSRKESKKTEPSRRLEYQRKVGVGSLQKASNQRKYKMPAAASVPVPSTIEVPELKTASIKLSGITPQKAPGVKPYLFKEMPQAKGSSVSLWKQASKSLRNTKTSLEKQINPFKDSKIKVSFSTTPVVPTATPIVQSAFTTRPSHLRNINSDRIGRISGIRDHSGSPSEVNHSIISPISRNVDDMVSVGRTPGTSHDGTINSRRLVPKLSKRKDNLEADTQPRKVNELQSWPIVSESAFLSKVKEAFKARLAKVNSSNKLKQLDGDSNIERSTLTEGEETSHHANTDMARSASGNIDNIDKQSLTENITYKCTMVCTKAQD